MVNKIEETLEKKKVGRRAFMRWFLGFGAFSGLAAISTVIATIKPIAQEQSGGVEISDGDILVFALGTNRGEPIQIASILPGQAALAFPQGKEAQDNLIMVLHLGEADLTAPTNLEWAPQGFVAYSAICTHLGCTVNYSHEPMSGAEFPHIHCPCHAGVFNPLSGGTVVAGPPPRPLPQLPLKIENDRLLAAGPFEEPVGIHGA